MLTFDPEEIEETTVEGFNRTVREIMRGPIWTIYGFLDRREMKIVIIDGRFAIRPRQIDFLQKRIALCYFTIVNPGAVILGDIPLRMVGIVLFQIFFTRILPDGYWLHYISVTLQVLRCKIIESRCSVQNNPDIIQIFQIEPFRLRSIPYGIDLISVHPIHFANECGFFSIPPMIPGHLRNRIANS